jgi:hypothetical protein
MCTTETRMRIHGLVHMVAAPLAGHGFALGAEQPDIVLLLVVHGAVLVVEHQQAFVVLAVDGKEMHAVVVVAQCSAWAAASSLPSPLKAGAPSSSGVPQGASTVAV